MGFSVVIITHNESKHIEQCIDSLLGLSDDIIVIDSYSSDNTVELAKKKGTIVQVYQKHWNGYGAAKNFGHSKAKYDWILSIDADERVSPQLYTSLKEISLYSHDVYAIKRINHIGSRAIKYGHLHPEWKLRLFNKTKYSWDDSPVHELLSPVSKSNIQLKGALLHYQAKDIPTLMHQYERYAKLGAKSGTPLLITSVLPIYHFVRSYILMGGFMEGKLGLSLAKAFYKMSVIKYTYSASDQAK